MKQRIEIIGRVGRDPEMRFTPSGQAVCNFTVAASEKYNNKEGAKVEKTVWFRISTWGKLAEVCNQFVKKGMLVEVSGKLNADEQGNPRTFEGKDGTKASFEVTAQEVLFLSRVDAPAEEAVPDDVSPF